MEALRLENVSRSFGQLQVLKDITLSVEHGERRVLLIGPNGAGKTTLFNLITGELSPTEGRIFLFTKDVTRMSPYLRVRLGLGRTYQIANLFGNLTVLENLLIALNTQKASPLRMLRPIAAYTDLYSKAKELLCKFGSLWEKRNIPVNQLSYGEMRKTELLLGLSLKPRILLLDEPTAGLTSSEAEILTCFIRDLPREHNTTVVMIEHDMKVAFAVADHITVLHHGRLLASGDPDEIRRSRTVREAYLGGTYPQ